MTAKYLLPCHDGNTVEVTTADAGRMIACPCGKNVQAPTLRKIQALPRAKGSDNDVQVASWTAQQGAMFSIGACLLLVSLIALGLLFQQYRRIDTSKPDMNHQALAEFEVAAASAEPANTLDVWYALRDSPLGEDRGLQVWEANRAVAQGYAIYMGIAGSLAAIGLLLAISGPLMRPAKKSPAHHRAPIRGSA
jgi:hypothetical protein